MPLAKRRRGGRAGSRSANPLERHLYLIFDDWQWGYSFREVNLTSRQTQPGASGKAAVRRLPEAFIRLEAPRGLALQFSAIGTRIVATHSRNPFTFDSESDGFVPIVDVRTRGVTFGPGHACLDIPIFFPVGTGLFALDTCNFRMLSFQPLWPPWNEKPYCDDDNGWSWRELPILPFRREDITSYAVHADELTILISTESSDNEAAGEQAAETDVTAATFTFDTRALVWKRHGEWPLPFHGRAHFVHCLKAFVGLSKDRATQGHLCACEAAATDRPPVWKLGKEKLFSEEPDETHVGATLVYMGGSEFCLVQCVSIADSNTNDFEQLEEEGDGIADGQEQVKEGNGTADGQEQLEEGDSTADQEQLEEGDGTTDDQEQLEEGGRTANQEQLEEGDGNTDDQEQLVEGDGNTDDQEQLEEGGEVPRCTSYLYRLTTFSLGYDNNGDLTTGESCQVQYYKVPEEITERFFHNNPVAFWL